MNLAGPALARLRGTGAAVCSAREGGLSVVDEDRAETDEPWFSIASAPERSASQPHCTRGGLRNGKSARDRAQRVRGTRIANR